MALSDEQRSRFERHLMLPEIGDAGQRTLLDSAVLLVGAGGLGSPVGIYLAAAGVGRIGVVDPDRLELGNLQRQIAHRTSDVGRPKVDSFRETLEALDPEVAVETHRTAFAPENALDLVGGYDLVLDCSDNFPSRYLANDAARLAGRTLVSGAILKFAGQVTVLRPEPGMPCYRCLYSDVPDPDTARRLSFGGVLGVVPGVIGTLMAGEAIKILTGAGEPLVGRLLVYEALRPAFREVRYAPDPACALCGDSPTIRRPAWIHGGPPR